MNVSILEANVWLRNPAEGIMTTIDDLQPDVLCLTELTRHSKYNPDTDIPQMIRQLGYYAFYEPTIVKNTIVMGNGIFSKFPFIQKHVVAIQDEDPTSPAAFIENRKYLEVAIAPNKAQPPLIVGSAHVSPPTRGELDFSASRLTEDNRLYNAIYEHTERFILAADLNVTPSYPLITKLLGQFKNAGPDLVQPSWSFVPNDESNAYDAGEADKRVDFVLVSNDLAVVSSELVVVRGSDHKGILTILDV